MKPKSTLRHFLSLAGSSLLAFSSQAHAAGTFTWTGGAGTSWNNSTNWGGTAPSATDDALVFDGTTNQANTNDVLTEILSLTLNNGGWGITLNSLTIGSGGIAANSASTLGGTLTLGGAQSWSNSTGLLTVTGTVNNNSNLFTIGGVGNTDIQSVISGAGGITKNGAGILTLSGANDYTGATTINVGTVKLGTNSALGTNAAGTSVTATGGALDLNGITLSTAEDLSLIGTGVSSTIGALTNSGAEAIYSGIVTIGTGGASIGGTGNIKLSAALAATANTLTKVGAGKLTLTANSTRTGAIQINGGALRIENASAFGTTATAITINNGGTLEVATTGEIVTAGAGANHIILNDGGTLLNGLTSGNVTISKFITIANTGTPVVTFNSGSTQLLIHNGSGARLQGGIAGAKIQIQGTGTVKIAANVTHTNSVIGDWVLQGGSLQIGSDGQLGNAANDVYFEGGTLSQYGAVTLGASRVLNFNHASGGTLNTAGTGVSLTLGTAGQLNGIYGLTKAGINSLILNAANAGFSGNVTISGGLLSLGDALALQSATLDTAGSIASTSTTTGLKTTVTTLTLGGLTGNKNFATLFNTANGYTGLTALTLNPGTGVTNSYAADIGNGNGSMTLTKDGLGTQVFTVAQTYTGGTTVTNGTLLVNNTTGSGTGSGTVTVGTLGTLGGSGTLSGAVTVDGALKPGNSPGLLTVGSLDLNANASTTLEINGTNRGALTDGYDALNVNTGGSIDLEGALSFVFGNLSAFSNGADFDLFSFDTTSTGDFAGVTSTGFYAGTWGKAGDIWSLDSGSQTLNFSEVTGNLSLVAAIPEPRAALLGSLGLLMLLRRRR